MDTGKLIREYRKKNGLTCLELANKLDVSQQYLGQVENGHKNASLKLIKKLVDVTKIEYEFWVSDYEYLQTRKELEKINNFIDVLIENGLIKNEDDILKDAFSEVLKSALVADVKHKLELKKIREEAR